MPASRRNRRLVAIWLFTVAGMVLVMIVLGGVTRLTGSGLSIMEWAPFRGALPPLNEAEWQRLFDLYQQIPQYALVNEGFGLAGFKQIFWLEWTHRLWGRLIGLAFLVPLVWFWATGRIERRLHLRLASAVRSRRTARRGRLVHGRIGLLARSHRGVAVPAGGASGACPRALCRPVVDRADGAAAAAVRARRAAGRCTGWPAPVACWSR